MHPAIGVWPILHLSAGELRLTVASHAVVVVVAAVAGAALAVRRARDPVVVAAWAPAVAVAALVGAHGWFRALQGGEGGVWTGGLASVGGIFAAVAVIVVAARSAGLGVLSLLDAYAPAGVLALGIGRIGCFLGGCCYGAPSTLSWAIVVPELGPPARHPLPLYSAALDLLVVAVAVRAPRRDGAATARACIGLGVVRCVLETLRDPGATTVLVPGWLTLPQAAALVLVAAGVVLVARRGQDVVARGSLDRLPLPATQGRSWRAS